MLNLHGSRGRLPLLATVPKPMNVVVASSHIAMRMGKAHALVLSAVAAAGVVGTPTEAQAEEVTPTAKGIVGTALLGGEVVVFGEAIFGVRSTAAYLIGGGLGVVAGGVGGYFIEQSVSDGRIPAYLLAGGLALLIPAIVVTLDATRYMPTEGAREDRPVGPPADPGKPGGGSVVGAEPAATPPPASTTPPATTPPANTPPSGSTPGGTTPAPAPSGGGGGGGTQAPQARAPGSMFYVGQGTLRIGAPVPEVRPIVSVSEQRKMGVVNSGNEVRFPVVKVAF